MSHPKFKAACVQAAAIYLDLEKTIEKAIGLIEEAARNDARLIAFPETWIPGYPWFIWLGPPIWGFQFVARYHDNSLHLDSAEMEALQNAAKNNDIYVLMGYSEKDGGSLYMGQSLIGSDGKLLFSRRKLKPTHAERTIFGEGDGSDFQVIDTDCGRIGAFNCWEHLQPLSKYAMFSLNEQVHVASWPSFTLYHGLVYALGPEIALSASQMYAAEGQCFVLCSTAITSQMMFDMLCDTPDKVELLNPKTGKPGGGWSMIFGPDGEPLCDHLPEDQEGILYAELDLGKITMAKAAADPVGHYSRPDVVRLLINRAKARCVQSFRQPMQDVTPVTEPERASVPENVPAADTEDPKTNGTV